MIKLSQVITLAKLQNSLTAVKMYVDGRISALAQSVSDIMGDVNTSLETLETNMAKKGNCSILVFNNKTVAASAWSSNSTFTNYPYRASISCSGVTADYVPDVIFSPDNADNTIYAPVASTANGVVYIYAKEKPTVSTSVLTIEVRKAVS